MLAGTWSERFFQLRQMLGRIRDAGLKLNPGKWLEVLLLSHVSADCIWLDPKLLSTIASAPACTRPRQIKRFLRMAGYYSGDFPRSLPPCTSSCTVINDGNEPQSVKLLSTPSTSTSPTHTSPHFPASISPFRLYADISNEELSAAPAHQEGRQENLICYANYTLNPAEWKYSATIKECLAVVWGIHTYRPYLVGLPFKVLTDYNSLQWLPPVLPPSSPRLRIPDPAGPRGG